MPGPQTFGQVMGDVSGLKKPVPKTQLWKLLQGREPKKGICAAVSFFLTGEGSLQTASEQGGWQNEVQGRSSMCTCLTHGFKNE